MKVYECLPTLKVGTLLLLSDMYLRICGIIESRGIFYYDLQSDDQTTKLHLTCQFVENY